MPIPSLADYSIAAVSKLTGVSCHVLRVWERRYGFPAPHRTASGHRRYTREQIAQLRDLTADALVGQPLSELIAQYRDLGSTSDLPSASHDSGRSTGVVLLELLFAGDQGGAEAILDRFLKRMSPLELIEEIIEPILTEIGERSYRSESEIYQERSASVYLLSRLHRLLDLARRDNHRPRRRVLVGSVEGDHQEGGYLMVALALELAGWRAIPLGVDLPVCELERAVESWRPDAVAVSFALSRNINKRFVELGRIQSVPVFVSGRSIVNHQRMARRRGLYPLMGPLSAAVSQLVLESEQWYSDQSRKRGSEISPPRSRGDLAF